VLGELGWKHLPGAGIAPGSGERQSWDELVIPSRLLEAMRNLNPTVPVQYLQQALAEITSPKSTDAITENHRLHGYLVDGFRGVSYIDNEGTEVTPTIRLISTDADANDWLAVNQVIVTQRDYRRRFDIVLYCNGLPVSVIELKKAGSAQADLASAHAQLQTYLREFPMAFRFAVCTVVSDGIFAKYGTPFTPLHHFSPWNVDDDGAPVTGADIDESGYSTGLSVALFGLFNQERFLQLQRSFTAFDEGGDGLVKRIAKPHQYFAVTKAVGSTVDAVESNGKAGVVWHTQGSGKSMEMELYANLVIRHPKLLNPTIVVITDRNELEGQLYQTFARSLLLPDEPKQVRRRAELRDEIAHRTTGGIYFTTLQKFGRSRDEREAGAEHPLLSDRRNIIVVVDEAHRSHYDDLDGYARHLKDALPRATLIAFTGTPVSFEDRNTREVFGDYIDVYDLTRAVERGHRPGALPAQADPGRPGRRRHGGGPGHGGRRGHHRARRRRAQPHRAERRGGQRRVRGSGPAGRARRGHRDAVGGQAAPDAPIPRRTRQGDDRLRHPRDLRQPLLSDRRAAPWLALRRPPQGRHQGRLLRHPVGHVAGGGARTA